MESTLYSVATAVMAICDLGLAAALSWFTGIVLVVLSLLVLHLIITSRN
jgi:hypothetical protein